PRAARTPKPRSVKLRPLRAARPTPSCSTQRIRDGSTPLWYTRSCSRRPTGSSANAVTTAVSKPKQRLSPRATLYSPPPSQTSNERVVAMRFSPGSKRTMISPRLTRSQRHCCFDLICRVTRSLLNNLSAASGDFGRLHFRGQNLNEEERDEIG